MVLYYLINETVGSDMLRIVFIGLILVVIFVFYRASQLFKAFEQRVKGNVSNSKETKTKLKNNHTENIEVADFEELDN